MRRLFILLLAMIVPLKAWAAVALPVALKMSHAGTHSTSLHAGAAGVHADHAADAAANCCDDHESGAMHSHECPHLAMPLLAAAAPLLELQRVSVPPPAMPASRLHSVVLDVPLQPPLALL